MDIYNQLIHGQGYAIIPVENMKEFRKLRDSFVKRANISNGSEKNINLVRKAMAKMSKAEINRSMIDLLKFTNLSSLVSVTVIFANLPYGGNSDLSRINNSASVNSSLLLFTNECITG